MGKIVMTEDGTHTIYHEQLQCTYHSLKGALQESARIFIELGLWAKMKEKRQISILEVGFGTGFNALLTALEADKNDLNIQYTGLEPFPVSTENISALNYDEVMNTRILSEIHQTEWGTPAVISPNFILTKVNTRLQDFKSSEKFDLVYYDAFAPTDQPELWTEDIFQQLVNLMENGGFLTTYCSKSIVRKAMLASGFQVEKHKGPKSKREVLRAIKA
ncbi:tRNA U34 5-methylaminomethyl-2-thiouridine-forming methyltransferase MnmC [Pseudarcicella hirudinis]|uniref:tRNA U34 5-methylaminomethyl-2-thiouridine-forming methyltransferase MnmC n=1 Tax=Pseudarcicella hirudinis TaxID=1079859 RepID=A0A1I5WPA4_9BACT|nr:tRNA (5-methylaminomethyl-2-thiouridine)(34)-methyltransferase MnmD [Pseudarcicella hirudinis]SFQ21559.1 tRNA U34 5-methylaminomethyl-2-thiouridine-forming methyltransferase MnmC [Pseudarcicella hirudinis]